MSKADKREMILNTIADKSVLKQDVFANTIVNFKLLKKSLKEIIRELEKDVRSVDERITVEYKDKGDYEAQVKIAGDILIFQMHTNVFRFDNSNGLWKTSYLDQEPKRGYCGVINIYNFLADSFKYNRLNDLGYLIARIFINNENHYMVQGKRQLGFLYNDFINSVMDVDQIKQVLESAILYTLDFDLLTPPYEAMKEVSVYEMTELSNNMQVKTGKRLGFQFQADSDEVIG